MYLQIYKKKHKYMCIQTHNCNCMSYVFMDVAATIDVYTDTVFSNSVPGER